MRRSRLKIFLLYFAPQFSVYTKFGIDPSYKMLTLLENSVNLLRTRHQSGEVYYWILYYSFLSPQKLKNVEEIIESLRPHIRDISSSTYYRLRKEAVTALSSVLWGFSAQYTLRLLNAFTLQE